MPAKAPCAIVTAPTRQRERLYRLIQKRHSRWLSLYQQADVWTDPDQRHRMLLARWQHQRTIIVYLHAHNLDRLDLASILI